MKQGTYSFLIVVMTLFCGTAFGQDYHPTEIIVKLKTGQDSAETYQFLGKAQARSGLSLKRAWGGFNMYNFRLTKGQTMEAALDAVRQDPNVDYAEPNYYVDKAGMISHGTFSRSELMNKAVSEFDLEASQATVQRVQSSVSAASVKTIVAVIDTGVDINHDVFVDSGAIWVNSGEIAGNGIDDDGNGYVDDVNGWNFVSNSGTMIDDDGHGTHVAGILLGVGQNIYSPPFSSASIEIMPLKFLDGDGRGTTSDAISAIYYAVNNGAKVLNNSWGGTGYSLALHEAVTYSYVKGTSFVAAAGNSGTNNDDYQLYPASLDVPNVIAVAATTSSDYLASFSNFGPGSVHLGAPGVFIYSTVPGDSYDNASGTSMASPYVAGVAALMINESPAMNGYQIREIINGEAETISNLYGKLITGARVDASNAIVSAQSATLEGLPSYSLSTGRYPSSELQETGAAGCGLVTKLAKDLGKKGPPNGGGGRGLMLFVVLLLPAVAITVMRKRSGKNRREFERYSVQSEVRVNVGGQELVGSVSSISLGGLKLDTDALLEKGGVVKMQIESPDGQELIEVEGRVVWSAENKAYGVQFQDASSSALNSISRWTRSLSKAS